MCKIIFNHRIVSVIFFLSLCGVYSYSQNLYSKKEVSKRLTSYYLNPDPTILPKLMRSIDKSQDVRESLPPAPIIGFFTAAFFKDSDKSRIRKTIDSLTVTKKLFERTLLLSAHKDTLLRWPDRSAEVNDIMWGAFFATGDPRYIDRIIAELVSCDRRDSLLPLMTGRSAKWSLSSNARQHSQVKSILKDRIKNASPIIKKHLNEALTKDPNLIYQQTVELIKKLKNTIK